MICHHPDFHLQLFWKYLNPFFRHPNSIIVVFLFLNFASATMIARSCVAFAELLFVLFVSSKIVESSILLRATFLPTFVDNCSTSTSDSLSLPTKSITTGLTATFFVPVFCLGGSVFSKALTASFFQVTTATFFFSDFFFTLGGTAFCIVNGKLTSCGGK